MTDGNGQTAVIEAPQAPMKWEESGVPAETVGLCRAMVDSGWFKDVQRVSQAIVKVQLGASLGLSPVESLIGLHIFETGKGDNARTNIMLGYQVIGAMIKRSGRYDYAVRRMDPEACEIEFYRITGDGRTVHIGSSRYTMETAKSAGIESTQYGTKPAWKAAPETMLYARALKNGAYKFTPDVMGGADVSTDEPFFEGEAQVIEGNDSPWPAFWAQAHELGMDKTAVHSVFGVPDEDGALKAAAEAKAEREGRTVADVVAEMADQVRAAVNAGEVAVSEWDDAAYAARPVVGPE